MTFEEEKDLFIETAKRFADAAFPVGSDFQYITRPGTHYITTSKGLSKREYFAGQVLASIINISSGDVPKHMLEEAASKMSQAAVVFADALLEELAK